MCGLLRRPFYRTLIRTPLRPIWPGSGADDYLGAERFTAAYARPSIRGKLSAFPRLCALFVHGADGGDDVGLHDAFDGSDLLQDGGIRQFAAFAIELRDQLVVSQDDDVGELAVGQLKRFQLVGNIGSFGRPQQLDE
jgi:hypothetical protein